MTPWSLSPFPGSIPVLAAKTYYVSFPFQIVPDPISAFWSFFLAGITRFINLALFPFLRSAHILLNAACSQRKGSSGKQARISGGLMRQTAFTQLNELGVELPTLGGWEVLDIQTQAMLPHYQWTVSARFVLLAATISLRNRQQKVLVLVKLDLNVFSLNIFFFKATEKSDLTVAISVPSIYFTEEMSMLSTASEGKSEEKNEF